MVAKIVIDGNGGVGYTLTVHLPQAWVDQFALITDIIICGCTVNGRWGQTDGDMRVASCAFGTILDAMAEGDRVAADIEAANAALAAKYSCEKEIEL